MVFISVWNPPYSSLSAVGEEQQQPPNLKQLWGPLGVSGQTQGHIISPHPGKFRNSDGLLSTRAQRHPCSAMALAGRGILLCFDGVSAFDGSTNVLCLMNNLPPLFPTCFSCSAHSIYTYLNSHLDLIKKSLPVGFLTVDLHVWPDFHGNRSPLTDLTLKGMVRNSLSLQKGQYRVKKKKKAVWKELFFNFECTPPLHCPKGFGFLAALLMFQ